MYFFKLLSCNYIKKENLMTPTKPLLALLLATTIAACSDNDNKKVTTKPIDKPVVTKPVEPAKPTTRAAFVRYDDTTKNTDGEYNGLYGAVANAYEADREAAKAGAPDQKDSELPFRDGASYVGYANFQSNDDVVLDAKLKLDAVFGQRNKTISGALSDFRNLSGREALDGQISFKDAKIVETAEQAEVPNDPNTPEDEAKAATSAHAGFEAPVAGKIAGGTFGSFDFDGTLNGTFRNGESVDGKPNANDGQYIFGNYDANEVTTKRNGGTEKTRTLGNINDGGSFAAEIVNKK